MSVQSLEFVITHASILKDLINAHVWKDMSLNHHELVDRKVMVPDWIVICIVEKKCYCNRLSSIAGGEEPWLLLANRKSIRQVSLNGVKYNFVFSNLSRTVAIDFDVGEGKLFWTDVTENAIYGTTISFDKDGGHPQKVS